jgi:hypothetical protein
MIDKYKMELVKRSTIAIGLVTKNGYRPKVIFGSGFFMRPEGYFISAYHVLDYCRKWLDIYNRTKLTVEMVAIRVFPKESGPDLNIFPMVTFMALGLKKARPGPYSGPTDLDIGIGSIEKSKVDHLPFMTSSKPELYDEICMCGYPAGRQSLDPEKDPNTKHLGSRFSPVMQFGRIAGFMPTDNSDEPYGIQTDLVGTGGSSGSPIVAFSGEAIGIAQQVFTSDIEFDVVDQYPNKSDKKGNTRHGKANIGLVYGVPTQMFPQLPAAAKKAIEENKPLELPIYSSNIRLKVYRKTSARPWLP